MSCEVQYRILFFRLYRMYSTTFHVGSSFISSLELSFTWNSLFTIKFQGISCRIFYGITVSLIARARAREPIGIASWWNCWTAIYVPWLLIMSGLIRVCVNWQCERGKAEGSHSSHHGCRRLCYCNFQEPRLKYSFFINWDGTTKHSWSSRDERPPYHTNFFQVFYQWC